MLSERALISLDDARDYLGLGLGDTDADEQLEKLIDAASVSILNFTGRDFVAADSETRIFAYDGSGYLSLANNDLRSISTITIGIDDPVTLEASSYRLRPLPSRHGVYTHLLLVPGYGGTLDTQVSICGDWGFASVPEDVQMACAMQVTVWQRKDRMAFTRAYNPDSGTVEGGDGLAGSVRFLLDHYRLPTVG